MKEYDDSVDEVVSAINSGKLELAEIVNYCNHASALVRANAIIAIGDRTKLASPLEKALILRAANDPQNCVELMGGVTVGMIAMATLLKFDESHNEECIRFVAGLRPSRQDVFRNYLASQGVSTFETAGQ